MVNKNQSCLTSWGKIIENTYNSTISYFDTYRIKLKDSKNAVFFFKYNYVTGTFFMCYNDILILINIK